MAAIMRFGRRVVARIAERKDGASWQGARPPSGLVVARYRPGSEVRWYHVWGRNQTARPGGKPMHAVEPTSGTGVRRALVCVVAALCGRGDGRRVFDTDHVDHQGALRRTADSRSSRRFAWDRFVHRAGHPDRARSVLEARPHEQRQHLGSRRLPWAGFFGSVSAQSCGSLSADPRQRAPRQHVR